MAAENERDNATVSRVNPDEVNQNQGSQDPDSGGRDDDKSKDNKDKKSDKKDKSGDKKDKAKLESKGSGVHDDVDSDGKKKKDDKESGGGGKVNKAMEREQQKRQLMMRLQQIHMASQAATAGVRFLLMAKLINMMKMMMQMALAVVQSAAQMGFMGFMGMLFQGAVQLAVNAVTAFAGFLGTTMATAATALVSGLLAIVVFIGSVVGSVMQGPATKDELYDCNTDSAFMSSATLSATAEELETAKTCYAFFKAYGLPDTNIAGILGNWSCESGIDPTGVETIYTEPRIIPTEGTRKWEAWQGTYEYTFESVSGDIVTTDVSPANFLLCESNSYGKYGLRTYKGSLLNKGTLANYSDKYPAIHYMGIGLGQWTNGRNIKLRKYADDHDGFEWYDLELQLMFMIDPNGGDDTIYIDRLAKWEEEPDAKSAAEWFCENWEGITFAEERGTKAEGWYNTITTWQAGVDYDLTAAETLVNSIMSAGHVGANSAGTGALRSCSGYVLAANDSAAMAALAYAWGPGEAYDNDGTECWKQIFEAIVGDEYYRSCDRTVAVAIKWSGTDSDYPNGSTQDQLRYLLASPRWDKVDWGGQKENLLPGDVLIRNDAIDMVGDGKSVGHTLMYVGVENVVKQFGEEYNGLNVRERGYCLVSGSINKYSPHVQCFTTAESGANDLSSYYVFRNREKYNSRTDWTDLSCIVNTPPAGAS